MVIARGFSDFLSRSLEKPTQNVRKTYRKNKHKWQQEQLGVKISLGEHVVLYIRKVCGDEFADKMLAGTDLAMPHRFWQRFIASELDHISYSQRERLRCYRALQFYVAGFRQGKRTKAAMLDGVSAKRKRRPGSEKNASKDLGIGHALLQYYIDEVQSLRSRADSVMLLDKARQLRVELLQSGYMEEDLPKLEDRAGISWFQRWRRDNAMAIHAAGLQLKVAWRKVLRRVRVFLINIFRLRIFFEMCHPGAS